MVNLCSPLACELNKLVGSLFKQRAMSKEKKNSPVGIWTYFTALQRDGLPLLAYLDTEMTVSSSVFLTSVGDLLYHSQ